MEEGVSLKKASTDNVTICQRAEVASPRNLSGGAAPKLVDGKGKGDPGPRTATDSGMAGAEWARHKGRET